MNMPPIIFISPRLALRGPRTLRAFLFAFVGVLHQQNIHRFNMRQGKTQEGFPNEIIRRLQRKSGA